MDTTARVMPLTRRVVAAVVALAAVVTVVAAAWSRSSAVVELPLTRIQSAASFPHETLSDWISFATHVVVIEVTAEAEVPVSEPTKSRGEGYVGRSVTLQPQTVLWESRDGVALPSDIELLATGWVLRQGQRYPAASGHGLRLEVGQRYLVPLTLREGEWSLLSPEAVFAVDSDGVVHPPQVAGEDDGTAAWALHGGDLAHAGKELEGARIDPDAVKYMDRPPYERGRAVIEDRARRQGSSN